MVTPNGNSQVNGSPAFSGSADLGNVSLNTNTGDADVDASQVGALVSGTAAISGTPFDPSGPWTIADVDFTLSKGMTGYTRPAGQRRQQLQWPERPAPHLNRLTGTDTSPTARTTTGCGSGRIESGGDPNAKGAMDACGYYDWPDRRLDFDLLGKVRT